MYSAIDMSTSEALKLAHLCSTGKDGPNLVRTRLQASGSSGHPERYIGIGDVIRKTYGRDRWRGFYRGLVPTLAKVRVPPSALDL